MLQELAPNVWIDPVEVSAIFPVDTDNIGICIGGTSMVIPVVTFPEKVTLRDIVEVLNKFKLKAVEAIHEREVYCNGGLGWVREDDHLGDAEGATSHECEGTKHVCTRACRNTSGRQSKNDPSICESKRDQPDS